MALKKSHFGLRVRAIWWEKEKIRRRKKEEEKRKIQVWNISFVWKLILVGLETLVLEILVEVWVRKTLTFKYMCFWLV